MMGEERRRREEKGGKREIGEIEGIEEEELRSMNARKGKRRS